MLAQVRLAMSRAADKHLAELRIRRLLAIELGRKIQLEREPTGPLGDELVQVWIDLTGEQVALHVRRMGRTLAQRTLDVGGYPPELAARMVALEASEMIRVQVGAAAPDPCSMCRATPKEPLGALARVVVAASGAVRWTPDAPQLLVAGPRLEVGHQHGPVRQTMFAEWLVGIDDASDTRWAAAGLAVDGRLSPGGATAWNLGIGARAALVALERRGDAPFEEWSAIAAARISAEVAVRPHAWVGIGLEPGLVLRPVDERLTGFTLGAALTVASGPTR